MREELLKPLLNKNKSLNGVREQPLNILEKIAIRYDNNKWALSDGLFEPEDLI
ncbi:hypothetical protein GN629_01260 [Campylobacter upsaliensis]|nr:hypothetical protein [Campylobacter upsaliensis]ELJ8893520.1 hypothetical protein [Campylobacter upsaliensis]